MINPLIYKSRSELIFSYGYQPRMDQTCHIEIAELKDTRVVVMVSESINARLPINPFNCQIAHEVCVKCCVNPMDMVYIEYAAKCKDHPYSIVTFKYVAAIGNAKDEWKFFNPRARLMTKDDWEELLGGEPR